MAERDEDEKESQQRLDLGLRDYLALMVAAMETFLLPLVAIIVVMAALAILLRLTA